MSHSSPSDRRHRLERLFLEALERTPVERAAYLSAECAEDAALRSEAEALLAAHEGRGALEDLAADLPETLVAALPEEPAGGRVGRYRLLRTLGRGGMGVVYLARRDDLPFEQQVALKVARAELSGDEVRRRIVAERDILARLNHPNITRLLDAGVTPDGHPYFAMELVDGDSIDVHCDRHRLTIAQRLELFCRVCEAMQYAHRNLVVHRDLKPGNILVTPDGVVKVLDFGIAKLLQERDAAPATRTGHRWLTPAYASPEQIAGEPVSTTTDVYAMGVVLYELLAGRRPFAEREGSPLLEHSILFAQPVPPSAMVVASTEPGALAAARGTVPAKLRRSLAGDLDTIVLKALQKEPERRYGTAAELGEDIRRLLAGKPVVARPDTLGYRLRTFVRRNRVAVGVAVYLALAAVAGTAAIVWQARRATEQAALARAERDRAEQVSSFLSGLFAAADPAQALGREITARELLDRGAARVEDEVARPEARAALLAVLGETYGSLGRYEEADRMLRRSLQLRMETPGSSPLEIARSRERLGALLARRGQYDSAGALYRAVLEARTRQLKAPHEELASVLQGLGNLHLGLGALDSAESYLRQAIAMRDALGAQGPALAGSLTDLAAVLSHRGDYAAADSLYGAALAIQRRVLPADHPELATTFNNLGVNRYRMGDDSAAAEWLGRAQAIRRRVLGEVHPDVAQGWNNLAAVLERLGQLDSAEALYRSSLAMKRGLVGDEHPTVARGMVNLGLLLEKRGELGAAESLLVSARRMWRRLLGDGHLDVARAEHDLALFYGRRGERGRAEGLLRRALPVYRARLPAVHERLVGAELLLGRTLVAGSRFEEAESLLVEAQRRLTGAAGAREAVESLRVVLAELYQASGKPDRSTRSTASPAGLDVP